MSNIAKKPIKIIEGVTVNADQSRILVTGPKGTLEAKMPRGVSVTIADGQVKIAKLTESQDLEKFAGLTRALISNMVEGVTQGFQKKLELSGVGYRAKVEGGELVLNVGFSVPIRIKPAEGIAITVDENVITVSGANKQLVGDVASNIRKVRPPDPYKAKGVKYQNERIRRKAGKAAKAVGAAK
jgi:large subunit ribosomal protein L6